MSWSTVRADQFCTLITDGTHDSPKPQQSGWKLITSKHLKGHYIDFDSANWISEADYLKVISRSAVEQWDILFSMIGTIGNIYLEKNPHVEYACKNMGIFKFSGNKENALWMYYYLRSPQAKAYIQTHLRGSTQAYVPLGGLREMPVPVPPQTVRNEIIAILRPIDEKIECNNAINDNLYAQARAIKRQWVAKSKDRYELLPLNEVAAINPDTYSPKEAWEYVNYLDTSSITNGFIADIQHIVPSSEKLPSRARRKVAAGDVLFSTVRPNQNHFGIISDPLPNMLASTGFAAIRSKNPLVCNELIYLCLTELDFIEKMQQLAEQSTSTFPSIKPSDLGTCQIPCPKDESSDAFTDTLKSLFALIAENFRENSSLATMREALLPKLMSGEIDVSAVQL